MSPPIPYRWRENRIKEPNMVRTRLASLALAAGLGLVCGCMTSSSGGSFLDRFRPACLSREAACCEGGVGGCESGCCGAHGAGPILDAGPGVAAPPETTLPAPLPAAPPRLVPAPQSTPMPYVPDAH
jgi:hypothetical protein